MGGGGGGGGGAQQEKHYNLYFVYFQTVARAYDRTSQNHMPPYLGRFSPSPTCPSQSVLMTSNAFLPSFPIQPSAKCICLLCYSWPANIRGSFTGYQTSLSAAVPLLVSSRESSASTCLFSVDVVKLSIYRLKQKKPVTIAQSENITVSFHYSFIFLF